MQAACRPVGTSPELAACVQLRHHEFDPGQAGLLLHVDWNAPPVVGYLNAPVGQQGHGHRVTMPGQGLIDGVVDDLLQCIESAESVDPMYMPGRLRTASRPSRTVSASAEYAAVFAGTCPH